MKISGKKRLPLCDKPYFCWIFCIVLLIPICGWSQTEVGLWTGADIKKNINRSFSLRLNTQARFTDDFSVARTFLLEPGLTYKLNSHWKITAYYRFIQRLEWDVEKRDYRYHPYSRFYSNLSYDRKLWKLKLDYRLRYQNQFKDDTEGDLTTDKSYLRNKLEFSYKNDSRFTPFISADLFYRIGSHFDQIRYKAGTEFDINKHHRIDLFIFTDQELDEQRPLEAILGIQYKLEF